MRRWAVLLAVAGCEAPAPETSTPAWWVYPPAHVAWPLASVRSTIGRAQAPQPVVRGGIAGDVTGEVRLPTPWTVPGPGPARAIVYGTLGGTHTIELIAIDTARVLWRDSKTCTGPVVGVTAEVVVCADSRGTRAIGLDGKPRWKNDSGGFVTMTEEHVVLDGGGETIVLDADGGDELAHIRLPEGLSAESVLAACGDAGRELFLYGQDERLVRVAEAKGGPAVTWSVPLHEIRELEACAGTGVRALTVDGLVALRRDTGEQTGAVAGAHAVWAARDGSPRIEVATREGVARWAPDLTGSPEALWLPPLGELLASRKDLRLVRATPRSAVLLDARGVRAYLPLAELGAALGDDALVAASWQGSPGQTVQRIVYPPRYPRTLRIVQAGQGLAVPAELRDLPAVVDVDPAGAVARTGTGMHDVGRIALDPFMPHVLYATTSEANPDEDAPIGVARFDLRARTWGWYRPDGCAAGTPVGLAVAGDLVVCASRGGIRGSSVRATSRATGTPVWEWKGENVDSIEAAGELVLVRDAQTLTSLDARDGHALAQWSSDDGAPMRAAVVFTPVGSLESIQSSTVLVTAQSNRVVGRLPGAQMAAAWTVAVDGIVASIEATGTHVLVTLEDGDAYLVDARTGEASAVAGVGLVWRVLGDLVAGEAPGGVIPTAGPLGPPPADKAAKAAKAAKAPGAAKAAKAGGDDDDEPSPPRLPRPWPTPEHLRASWQLTLYDRTGGLHARNDFALPEPITPATVRAPGGPIVVGAGPGLREILVLDPQRGDPVRRIRLPEEAPAGLAFSTVVDGKPLVGTVMANPLRVLLF